MTDLYNINFAIHQIAAKINQPAGDGQGIKRPFEDGAGYGKYSYK